jgi:excisionase family DNA binding protein
MLITKSTITANLRDVVDSSGPEPASPSDAAYLTVRDTARILSVHENTVRNWVKTGYLRSSRLPGSRAHRFNAADVNRLADERGAIVSGIETARRVVAPELIDATQLEALADRIESRRLMPELMRRLLAATEGVHSLSMRAGEGIAYGGWDGLASSVQMTPWVPAGGSAWELGSGKQLRAKVLADFEKRTAEPLGVNPAETTFVLVTLRRWIAARATEAELRDRGRWRDVRILDADDLEAWLQATPSVHHWISEQLGFKPQGARTLPAWLTRLTNNTRPGLPHKLFLAGRERPREELRRLLDADPSVVSVQARWRDDALGFIAAALEPEEEERGTALVVSDPDVWPRLVEAETRMLLIPTFDGPDIAEALRGGHHVIVPVGAQETAHGATIVLPPVARGEAQDAFTEAGVEFRQADRLAGLARRSMASLVRRLSLDPRITNPIWAEAESSWLFALLMLVGSWSESQGDLEILTELTGREWQEIEGELLRYSRTEDSPFVRSGGRWHLTAPEEAFALLQGLLSTPMVDRWIEITAKVLEEKVASQALPSDQALFASINGAPRAYSSALREGLADGLALVGSLGERDLGHGVTLADRARDFVRSLLHRANDDASGQLWRSLSTHLPRLAEAAPDLYLDAINVGSAGEPLLECMFTDTSDSSLLFGSSPHTGLLWSLEILCWSPEYLGRAGDALARLAEIDPGGRLANRPPASLRAVFLPWVPYTAASLQQRLAVLDRLRTSHPAVGWELLLSLMPRGHDFSSPTSEPRFRDWKPDAEGVSIQEWSDTIDGVIRLTLEEAADDPARWASLIEHLGSLSPVHREELLDRLDQVVADPEKLDPEPRLVLWRALVDESARHRTFPDVDWSMDDRSLDRIDAIARAVEPTFSAERHARLFEWRPHIPGVDPRDHDAYETAARDMQVSAITEVFAEAGLDGLVALARVSKRPDLLGWLAADVVGDELSTSILALLGRADSDRRLAQAWVSRMTLKAGASWSAEAWSFVRAAQMPARTAFLQAMPTAPDLRVLLDTADSATQVSFWESADPWRFAGDDATFAIEQFLAHDRPWVAISLLSGVVDRSESPTEKVTPQLVEEVLRAALLSQPAGEVPPHGASYDIGLLLDYLERELTDETTLRALEWAYFPALRHERDPRSLFAELARQPSFFVQLIVLAFRGNDEAPRKLNEHEVAHARIAYELLDSWRRAPGSRDDGSIDPEVLTNWVRAARTDLQDHDRGDIGDELIGQLLSGSAEGADNIWPAEPVRDLVESIGSQDLETGLHIGRANARGFTSRGVFDGGQQERSLAEKYRDWAASLTPQWPRTARMLRGLAESYERDARRNDSEADLRQNEP